MTALLILTLVVGPPADTLSLELCYAAAEKNHPLAATAELYDRIEELRLANINAGSLPRILAGGQASYQSAVPEIPFGEGTTVSNDQYRMTLGVEHILYAGGVSAPQREAERLQRQLQQSNAAVEVYRIRDQVEVAYFGVLLQQSIAATLRASEETLEAELAQMEARIAEGVATAGDADVLLVELIGLRQRIADAEASRSAAMAVLAVITGLPLGEETALSLPESAPLVVSVQDKRRPEYATMNLSRRLLSAQQEIVARKERPQLGAMVEAAYGRPPGQNFFEDSFSPFFTAGLRLQWVAWDWGRSGRDRAVFDAESDVMVAREEAFTQALRATAERQARDIERIADFRAQDEEIISLRERITAQAASRLANGVITATQYVLARNAEQQARLAREMHRIQLAQARAMLATTLGAAIEPTSNQIEPR